MTNSAENLGFLIRVISNEIERRANQLMKDVELTKTQSDVIHYVCKQTKRNRTVCQKDIENFFHVSNPSVSGTLNRLESKGLITRTTSPDDKRIHYIVPTEEAWKLEKRIYENLVSLEYRLVEDIDPELTEQGLHFLRCVAEKIGCRKQKGETNDQNLSCSDQAV